MKKLNRIISPILAVLTLPILYFTPILNIFVSSGLLTNDDGTKANALSKYLELRQYMSINYLIHFTKDENHSKLLNSIVDAIKNSENGGKISDIITSINWLYAAIAFLGVLVAAVIVFTVITALGKSVKASACVCAGGIASAFIMNICFNAFAKPFLSGKINVSSILSSASSGGSDASSLTGILGTLSGLINRVATVDIMQLSVAYTFTVVILAAVLILCVCASFSKD